MKRSRALIGITAAASAAAATALLASGTTATAGTVSDPIAEGFAGPLQIAFDSADRVLVTNAFGPGAVSRVNAQGNVRTVVEDSSGSISGVAARGDNFAYTLAGGMVAREQGSDSELTSALRGEIGSFQQLKLQNRRGDQKVLADLGRVEDNRNPDGHQVYGWLGYRDSCEVAPEPQHQPRAGIVESNPHAVAAAPGGGWYVADAAANTIWKVKGGKTRVAAVLKPQTVTITDDMVQAYELDSCTEGTRYNFEPVPTDIEVGPGGLLYVSLLPGEAAPFSGEAGAVVRVNPVSGKSRLVSRGFTGATNLALAGHRIFVTELFAGRVSMINTRTGNVRPVAYMSAPAAVGHRKGKVYVTDIEAGTLSLLDPTGPTAPPLSPSPTVS